MEGRKEYVHHRRIGIVGTLAPTAHPVNALPFSIREVARTTVIALDA